MTAVDWRRSWQFSIVMMTPASMTRNSQIDRCQFARRSIALLAVACCGIWLQAGQAPRPAPDFSKTRDEAVQLLQSLIQIDTSNPPGNETVAAEYIKGLLDKEGIASEIHGLQPGRGNIVARLKGNGRKRPLLLMAHTDVVGVERDKWTVDPFGGVIKNGYLYGRGAIDDKDSVAAALVDVSFACIASTCRSIAT